jgi:hypothetical protein
MYLYIFSSLQRMATMLLIGTKIREIPDMLEVMVKFLQEEPEENFSVTSFEEIKNVPLTLNDKALDSFKDKTSTYPGLYATGKAGQKDFNFLYVLGQLLTNAALVFSFHEQNSPKIQEASNRFYEIWGSHDEMNARSLVHKYSGEKTGETIRSLILRMKASITLINKRVLPLL